MSGGPRTRVTRQEEARMVQLYDVEKRSSVEVGHRLGRDHTTVLWHMRRLGVPIRTAAEGSRMAIARSGRRVRTTLGDLL